MVYEVKVYSLVGCYSTKLKKFVRRWILVKKSTNTFNSKKELNRYINNWLSQDKELMKLFYYYKYSIRVLKGGSKRGKA